MQTHFLPKAPSQCNVYSQGSEGSASDTTEKNYVLMENVQVPQGDEDFEHIVFAAGLESGGTRVDRLKWEFLTEVAAQHYASKIQELTGIRNERCKDNTSEIHFDLTVMRIQRSRWRV